MMGWVLERHRSNWNLCIASIFHRSALCLKNIARSRCRQFLNRRLFLKVIIIATFNLWCATYLSKFLLFFPDVINHSLMTIFFFLLFSVLLFFFLQSSHVPWLGTLWDNLRGRCLSYHFNFRHNLNIYLLIHYVSLVEHILWRHYMVIWWCITSYPRCLLLVDSSSHYNWFLLGRWRRTSP